MYGTFELAYEVFLKSHSSCKSKERKQQIAREHGYEEQLFLKKVWWPLVGNFDHLHPEYEVRDWRGRVYYEDFVYLSGHLKLLIRVENFVPNAVDMDSQEYSDQLNRESFLQASGFRVISFTFHDIEQRPELCRYLLQILLNRYQAAPPSTNGLRFTEMEVVRLALISPHRIHPAQVALHLNIDSQTASLILQSLCSTGWLRPVRIGFRENAYSYELVQGFESPEELDMNKKPDSLNKKRSLPIAEAAPEGIYS